MIDQLHIGIVGVGGRSQAFLSAIEDSKKARLISVCDLNIDAMNKATEGLNDINKYVDYEEMIQKDDLDAIIIGTPMQFHVPQAIAALENNIHVFSEVTAAVSMNQCKELVAVCKKSKAKYMLGENCNYMKPYMMIKEMVKAGIFGEVYYAEGEYLHDVKDLSEVTTWRKIWIYGKNGITYGTHSLGPILSWFEGDRVARVSCTGSGHHYKDSHGIAYKLEDTCVMIAKTKQKRLIKIRLDTESNRPYNLKYILQGTKGCFDSSRGKDEIEKLWIKGLCKEEEWIDLDTQENAYLPDLWRQHGKEAEKAGHCGSDYIIMTDFIDSIIKNKPMPIGIHESMDMTLPGLVSQKSIESDGVWLDVPDSRTW